jgi:hypothetical protein
LEIIDLGSTFLILKTPRYKICGRENKNDPKQGHPGRAVKWGDRRFKAQITHKNGRKSVEQGPGYHEFISPFNEEILFQEGQKGGSQA